MKLEGIVLFVAFLTYSESNDTYQQHNKIKIMQPHAKMTLICFEVIFFSPWISEQMDPNRTNG